MLKTETEKAKSEMNPNVEILINHFKLFIYEHQYVEFKKQYNVIHDNRLRDNANQLYYFLDGGGYIEYDNERISLSKGDIAFYPIIKNTPYHSVFFPGTKKVVVSFYFNIFSYEDIFSELRKPILLKDTYNLIPLIHNAVISNIPSNNILLHSLVTLSIKPLFEMINPTINDRLMRGMQYESLFRFIDNNLYIDLTLEEISKNTGMSVSYLTHTFPKNVGFSIKQYIHKNILKSVCLDLAYTELRIKDIASKYHFGSDSYFSEWFYKKYQKRPNAYRKIFKNFSQYHLYVQ